MIIESSMCDNQLQVSYIENLSSDYTSDKPFYVKNNTTGSLDVTIIPFNQDTEITTKIYPGWEAVCCKYVQYQAGLQIGY